MAKRPSKRSHHKGEPGDLNLTPIMNVFIIVIPFLLLTAVFAKTAIIDIYLPQEGQGGGGGGSSEQKILAIKVTKTGFEIGGVGGGARIGLKDNALDFKGLNEELVRIKDRAPSQEEVILLFDQETSYDIVVKVMDAARETTVEKDGVKRRRLLFPAVSLGENE
jgi:biopolymer transport protein ExbD